MPEFGTIVGYFSSYVYKAVRRVKNKPTWVSDVEVMLVISVFSAT